MAKDRELHARLNSQGVIDKIPSLDALKETLQEHQSAMEAELNGQQGSGDGSAASPTLEAELRLQNVESSLINDISGEAFRGFDDACWILLTSQRPASQLHSPSKRELKLQAQRNLQALAKTPSTVGNGTERRPTASGRAFRS